MAQDLEELLNVTAVFLPADPVTSFLNFKQITDPQVMCMSSHRGHHQSTGKTQLFTGKDKDFSQVQLHCTA